MFGGNFAVFIVLFACGVNLISLLITRYDYEAYQFAAVQESARRVNRISRVT